MNIKKHLEKQNQKKQQKFNTTKISRIKIMKKNENTVYLTSITVPCVNIFIPIQASPSISLEIIPHCSAIIISRDC